MTSFLSYWRFAALLMALVVVATSAFAPSSTVRPTSTNVNDKVIATPATQHRLGPLGSSAKPIPPKRRKYVPKWKKKKTLAETMAEGPPADLAQIGLKGNIKVVFRQGNETKTTMALEGQLLRDVAIQAGQFIKYGCGKGECGTCESLVNGQWIRPCSTRLPAVAAGEEYLIQVKETKAKTVSSGRFYSVRSIVLGFWNNLLGMVGFVRDRRLAKKNWDERKEYEDLVRQKTLEKKRARLAAEGKLEDPANSKLSP